MGKTLEHTDIWISIPENILQVRCYDPKAKGPGLMRRAFGVLVSVTIAQKLKGLAYSIP